LLKKAGCPEGEVGPIVAYWYEDIGGDDVFAAEESALSKGEEDAAAQRKVRYYYQQYADSLKTDDTDRTREYATMHNDWLKKLPKNKWMGHSLLSMGSRTPAPKTKAEALLARIPEDHGHVIDPTTGKLKLTKSAEIRRLEGQRDAAEDQNDHKKAQEIQDKITALRQEIAKAGQAARKASK